MSDHRGPDRLDRLDRLDDDLALLAEQTTRLLGTARSLTDTAAASLCEGWSRGHVVTHLARNAEAIGRLADWAVTGTPLEMYPGGTDGRDRAIEAGAHRGVDALAEDLADTAAALVPRLEALAGPLAADEVELRGGYRVRSTRLPFTRLREVVYHHVDLDAGFGFADVDGDLLCRFVDDAVARLELGRHPPALRLTSDEGDTWTVGDGTTPVTGARAGLLLWLARRIPDGVHAQDAELPSLPRGA
jgi:maleylpyruvate isomerase